MKNTIEEIISKYGFGISVKELASCVYIELAMLGYEPCVVNDLYIRVEDANFQLVKSRSKGHWTVKEF